MSDGYEHTDADAPSDEDGFADVPWDLLTEQSVLGSMLIDPRVIDDVLAVVRPEHFYLPKHEAICAAIVSIRDRTDPVDAISVVDELTRAGKLRAAGGIAYPHELTGIPSTAANAGFHAERVYHFWQLRELIATGQRIIQKGRASEGDAAELVDAARLELDRAAGGKRGRLHTVGEGLADLADFLDAKPDYLPTPWESLDKVIAGFAPGRLYYVGARPGEGKTLVLLNAATTLAKHGAVAFSSLEMTEQELQMRLIASYGPLHLSTLTRHTLNSDDWDRFVRARSAIAGAPIFVDDTAGQTMADIRAHARAVARMGNLKGVFIDYLQLIQTAGTDRRVAMDEVSRQAKLLAKELQVPVIAAVQLRRAGMRKGLPGLDDIREAGGLEQDADAVILLHRDPKRSYERTVIVAKNRHGEQGKFRLTFKGEYARLEDRKWTPSALLDEEEIA